MEKYTDKCEIENCYYTATHILPAEKHKFCEIHYIKYLKEKKNGLA